MSKNEWELNIFPGITFNSLNNGINEQINILNNIDYINENDDNNIITIATAETILSNATCGVIINTTPKPINKAPKT